MRVRIYLRPLFQSIGTMAILISAKVVGASSSSVNPGKNIELRLPDAVYITLSRNHGLMASRRTLEGDTYLLEAAQSEFYPKILPAVTVAKMSNDALFADRGGISNSYGIQFAKKFDIGTAVSVGPANNFAAGFHYTTLSYTLSQPLLRGFGTEYNLDKLHQAEYLLASSTQDFGQTKINTVLEMIHTYYEALKQKRIVEMSKSLADRLQQHVLLTKMKEKRGLTGRMDTYRATIRLKDAEDAIAEARNSYATGLGKLKWMLNLSPETEIELRSEETPQFNLVNPEKEAEASNLELIQLRTELKESHRSVRVAGNATLPDVGVQLNYYQPIVGDVPSTQQRWSVTLLGSSDLFHGAERSNHDRARARAESAQMRLEYKIADIRRRVSQQFLDLAAAKERITLRQAQIKEAEGKLALAKVKFSNDMADNFNIMESEMELQRAQISLISTQTDYALGVYDLKAITGHLLDAYKEAKNQ